MTTRPAHQHLWQTSDRYSRNGVLVQDRFCEACHAAQAAVPVRPVQMALPVKKEGK